MSDFDYDHVASDFEPECECSCWECRQGRHASCTHTSPLCVIARTCNDCGTVDGCTCGALSDEELDTTEYDVPLADDSPMRLDGVRDIIERMGRLEL
jgi:hypothetical protein